MFTEMVDYQPKNRATYFPQRGGFFPKPMASRSFLELR
jgi:hypothetical protein